MKYQRTEFGDTLITIIGLTLCGGMVVGAIAADSGCTKPEAQQANAVAIDLTNAICSVAQDSPTGEPWTDIICTIAEVGEDGIGEVIASDAGASIFGSVSPTIQSVRIRLPNNNVNTFLELHKKK